MKAWTRWLAAGGIVLAAAYGGYRLGLSGTHGKATSRQSSDAASSRKGPAVPVRTAPIRRKTITETATAYGRVVAQPGETRVRSLPFETVVHRVLVTAGQQVEAGASLVEISASPAARLQLKQAEDAYDAADQQLQQVEQEYKQRLTVKRQLVQARQAASSARLKLETLRDEGVGQPATLKAKSAGIVSKVDAREGQIVGAGGPLVEVANGDRIEVKLGVEPEDIPQVHVGDTVELTPVHLRPGPAISGHVRLVTRQVNLATQLIDVLVSLPPEAGLTLLAYVRGTLVTASHTALVVPRAAVLPERNGYKLFTIKDGHAVRHKVEIGLETHEEVEVRGDHLKPGDQVVLEGNYELKPGMAVTRAGNP